MSAIDIAHLLAPVAPEKPSGDSLEYDPAYTEMMRASVGKPEQRMGDAVIPGEEPNWKEVKGKAIALLLRSKDLRTAVQLTQALLRTDGFPGMADGLALIRGLVESQWDSVHPQLDPDDGNDPTMRVNTLMALAAPEGMLRGVRDTPLGAHRVYGKVSLKDVFIATGKLQRTAADAKVPEAAVIEGVFRECDSEALQKTFEAIGRAQAELKGVEAILGDKAGGAPTGFRDLASLLKLAEKTLQEKLASRGLAAAAGDGESAPAVVATAAGDGGLAMSGEITSREQAMQILERVADYFARHEPSSPVPLLLRRAKRLVAKSFIDIVRDLAPDGLSQVEKIRGEEQGD
jgi:type VI secretion system protein ImpA